MEQAADEYIAECKFVVRTSPALHGRLAVEAAEQNVSMNQWVIQKLADRRPSALFDL